MAKVMPKELVVKLLSDLGTLRVMTLCWLLSDAYEITDFTARLILEAMMKEQTIFCKHGSLYLWGTPSDQVIFNHRKFPRS